jgi:hypothetical protein
MKSRPVYPDRKGGMRFWYKGSWIIFLTMGRDARETNRVSIIQGG